MVKNIIYDMGNVLIHWDPERLIARLGVTGADAADTAVQASREVEFVGVRRGMTRTVSPTSVRTDLVYSNVPSLAV